MRERERERESRKNDHGQEEGLACGVVGCAQIGKDRFSFCGCFLVKVPRYYSNG